jgi:hypothetical protein
MFSWTIIFKLKIKIFFSCSWHTWPALGYFMVFIDWFLFQNTWWIFLFLIYRRRLTAPLTFVLVRMGLLLSFVTVFLSREWLVRYFSISCTYHLSVLFNLLHLSLVRRFQSPQYSIQLNSTGTFQSLAQWYQFAVQFNLLHSVDNLTVLFNLLHIRITYQYISISSKLYIIVLFNLLHTYHLSVPFNLLHTLFNFTVLFSVLWTVLSDTFKSLFNLQKISHYFWVSYKDH